MEDLENALTTVRFEIRIALADTAHITGLRAGDASEVLINAIIKRLRDPATQWAFRAILTSPENQ